MKIQLIDQFIIQVQDIAATVDLSFKVNVEDIEKVDQIADRLDDAIQCFREKMESM